MFKKTEDKSVKTGTQAQGRQKKEEDRNSNLAVMDCKYMQEKRAGERKMMSP